MSNISAQLRRLLIQGSSSTQEELCKALSELGFEVNQSKISRLLRRLGAVKTKNEHGQIVYRLPKEPAPPTKSTPLQEMVIDIMLNETTIVIHTTPGAASMVARILDYQPITNQVLGTLAGDDTIMVIPKSIHSIDKAKHDIEKLLLGE